VEEENMTASHPVFKPVTLPDFQNGNDTPWSVGSGWFACSSKKISVARRPVWKVSLRS